MKNGKLLLSVLLFVVMGMMTNLAISAPYLEGEATGWTQIGPNNYAGRTRAAIFDKNNDGVIYVGTVGGLYVSVNYGKNWQEISLGDVVANVTAITQAEDGRIYIATGEGYYDRMLHAENSIGHSNQTSGSVGIGVYMQTSGFGNSWVKDINEKNAQLSATVLDSLKYDYVAKNFKFEVMKNTIPSSKYDFGDEWAYINTILYANNTLYVGTKNNGLKYTKDVTNADAEFSSVSIDGNSSFNISDLKVNSEGKLAVAYESNVAIGTNPDNFKVIFNSDVDTGRNMSIGRIKLFFGEKNPNDLFVFAASDLSNVPIKQYHPSINGLIYGIYRPYYTKIKGGKVDEKIGVENLKAEPSNWFNVTTSSMATIAGTSLGWGMSIYVDDRAGEEKIYLGGSSVLLGQDFNGEGKFSFAPQTSALTADTAGINVGINIHNILPLPNPKNIYDSTFLFVTSDMGAYRLFYDSITGANRWWSSGYGLNNLQTYKVTSASDGSVFAASQSNAIVYIPSVKNSLQRGSKIWSVNNPGYPSATDTTINFAETHSGSSVNASAIYRVSPSKRKPVLLSRPGTNLTRTYSDGGDYDAVNDQTWTYGHTQSQTFLIPAMTGNLEFDPFNTPTAVWESFDFKNTIDSIEVALDKNTNIRRNGVLLDTTQTRDGNYILVGDSILVESDNLGYPFFHVMKETDLTGISKQYDSAYTKGTGDTLLWRNDYMKIKVPQLVQARALVATNEGAFICGKVFDFSRTINPNAASEHKWGNLAWARLYKTGDASSAEDLSTMNNRIHAVALTQDGTAAFLAVDVYSSTDSYAHTNLVRISGLNSVNISNDSIFRGNNADTKQFTIDTVKEFSRQISSIVCNPTDANDIILTFEGTTSSDANIMQTKNALNSYVDFNDISLTIDRKGNTVEKNKPVFTALYESVNAGKSTNSGRIYVGSDDGIYYRDGSTWIAETANVPNVPVFNLWQQTKKLPKWMFYSYKGDNAELMTFEATANTGVIYAATYGKGILINRDFQDTNDLKSNVSLKQVVRENSVETLTIFPNPASYQSTISYNLKDASNVEFRMYDLNGREVSSFNVGRQSEGEHMQVIDVQNLQRGIYMIQMKINNTSTRNAKLIVK